MKNGSAKVEDRLKRPLRDLRLSVTDKCNFRCRYCMPEEMFGPDYPFLPQEKLLTFEEITRLVRIFTSLGVGKIRITGGEPLLRRELPTLVGMIRQVDGVKEIAMTTNGYLLPQLAQDLKEAGLDRVTISLDSLDDQVFAAMNGRGIKVSQVLAGIEAAERAGLPIKINMVVQKGVNDGEILSMARFFKQRGHILRFIEYMDVGNANGWSLEHVLPSREIVGLIDEEMPIKPVEPLVYGEVAKRYRYVDDGREIGFISSVTEPFCATCTRARLSAEGVLYTCLFATEGTDLRGLLRSGATDEEIRSRILEVWTKREDRYSQVRLLEKERRKGKKVEMYHIGG